jgi:hypothetical protein
MRHLLYLCPTWAEYFAPLELIAYRDEFNQQVEIVIGSRAVPFDVLALDTFMNDDRFATFLLRANRFHQPAALRCPITGVYIDVLTP